MKKGQKDDCPKTKFNNNTFFTFLGKGAKQIIKMACGSCGTGTPNGCKSNGGCSSGGCNRMNVHDWLLNLPIADAQSSCQVVEVSFNNGSRKDYFRNYSVGHLEKGEMIAVEAMAGFDVGEVSMGGELVRLQLKKLRIPENSDEIKKILRRAGGTDLDKWKESKARERDILIRARAIAKTLNLNMKISEVELQADGKKCTFFYIADDRVDFRELIKQYAGDFKVKVEMRQIGARQEAAKVGGIGICGRELCCSSWLHDFKSVNTQAARYQNLSINQTKLSGQCGRLKCCLNYELDTYLDALQFFPNNAESLELKRGRAFLAKKDIFKNLMWYTLPDSNKQYPLSLKRVEEIIALNKKGIQPEELMAEEVVSTKIKEVEPEFVDVVGQITLRSLDNKQKKKNQQNRNNQNRPNNQPAQNNQTQGNKPPQQPNRPPQPNQANKPNQPGQPNNNPNSHFNRNKNKPNNRPNNPPNNNKPPQP